MSDDWKPGDLALCVKMGPWEQVAPGGHSGIHPQPGCFYVVEDVGRGRERGFLGLLGFWGGYHASRFRKVTPPEADAFDREVIEQMTGMPATAEGVGS